jgi:hypothetical protein
VIMGLPSKTRLHPSKNDGPLRPSSAKPVTSYS